MNLIRELSTKIGKLIEIENFAEARNLIECTPGALKSAQIRNRYAQILSLAGDHDRAEAIYVESVLLDVTNLGAISRLIALGKGYPRDDITLERCKDLARETGNAAILGRLAAIQLGRGEIERAWASAMSVLAADAPVAVRNHIRKTLANIMTWYGYAEHAEALIKEKRHNEHWSSAAWDLAKLWQINVFEPKTRELLEALAFGDSLYRDDAAQELFDFRWKVEGSTNHLFEESGTWAISVQNTKLQRERIALAYELGRNEDAIKILHNNPECRASYDQVLPIARLLEDHPDLLGTGVDTANLAGWSQLHRSLQAASAEFAAIATKSLSTIAIVGNSPNERALGRGAIIDAHDFVVRFNRASVAPPLDQDYGSKTNVHVLPIGGETEGRPISSQFVLFTIPDALSRNRNWRHVKRLMRTGLTLACLTGNGYSKLVSELKAPPSNGLRVCHYFWDSCRDRKRIGVFGFSFTDQIGKEPTSSHYFEKSVPSMHHNWLGERRLYASWYGDIEDKG